MAEPRIITPPDIQRTAMKMDQERIRRDLWSQQWLTVRKAVFVKKPGFTGWICRVIGAVTGRFGMGAVWIYRPTHKRWMEIYDEKRRER